MWGYKYDLLPGSSGGAERLLRQRILLVMVGVALGLVLLTAWLFQHKFWTPVPAERARLGDWIGTDAHGRKLYELGKEAEDSYKIDFVEGYEGTTE